MSRGIQFDQAQPGPTISKNDHCFRVEIVGMSPTEVLDGYK